MLRLKTPNSKPVRVWWYDIGDVRYSHVDETVLFKMCEKSQKLPPELCDFSAWYADMVHHICLTLPPAVCYGEPLATDQRTTPLTFAQVGGFLKAMAAVLTVKIFTKAPIHVGQAEADRRAEICYRCSLRGPVGCVGCHGFIQLADKFIQGRELTKHQAELSQQGCRVCGCFLSPTLWAHPKVLAFVDKKHIDLFPEHCWRSEDDRY